MVFSAVLLNLICEALSLTVMGFYTFPWVMTTRFTGEADAVVILLCLRLILRFASSIGVSVVSSILLIDAGRLCCLEPVLSLMALTGRLALTSRSGDYS